MGRPWFRRRSVGVGWRPVSWQGWAITVVAAALVIGVFTLLHGSSARIPILIAILVVYAVMALATGGARTTPAPAADDAHPAEGEAMREPLQRPRPSAVPRLPQTPPTSGEPALVVEHLTKRFGDRLAVDDVSFSVAAGEVFGFLGPNGAGKTTTVRMLATLISQTSGSAIVAGIPLEPDNGVEIRQRIAVMPENPGLYLRLTVAENLEFFAGLYGLGAPRERIGQALEAVNLAGRANDLCGSLSKGLRQRVGVARSLLSDPAIVFLDEPTSGLDPVASREVHELIDGLRGRGVTVFLTTHRLEEAERLCDRVAILNTRLRTIGRPDELRDRLFTRTLVVRTVSPLDSPKQVFSVAGVESWRSEDTSVYVLTVEDQRTAAPAVTRALVAAGADVLSLAEARRSLEDVYLELIDDDVEARR
ncbi:MAG TPA: ABC transporter ATP-binding protein [Gaiellaceae bacterium]|nr:ABC transporter ATP-binding protein [Gaiellaceae bacterium]